MHRNLTTAPRAPQSVCRTAPLQDTRALWIVFLAPFVGLLLLALPAFAQPMPENARASSYGDGWECNIGYRLDGDICAAVVVPENAYETNRSHGAGWECHHGFRKVDGTACVAVVVPAGGFLDASGERWHCLRGVFKQGGGCQESGVPENGYLLDGVSGAAWEGARGEEKVKDSGA